MFKGFPAVMSPRRPSSVVRYLLAVFLVITVLYAFSHRNPPNHKFSTSESYHDSTKTQINDASPHDPDALYDTNGEKVILAPPIDTTEPPKEEAETTLDETTKQDDTEVSDADADVDSSSDSDDSPIVNTSSGSSFASDPDDSHPIGKLIYDAQHIFAELLSKESQTIEDAAQAYRKRRGRHPPPGFDKWYEFAREKNAIIVEDFFDQIYDDLQPFWGLEPTVLRKESWDYEMTIHIRDGKAESGSDWFWTVIWLDLISTIEHLLPDMDLPLNAMDEPRLVVPWEDIEAYMQKAVKTMKLPRAKDVRSDHQKLPAPGRGDPVTVTRPKNFESTRPYWPVARRGCPPDSLARTTDLQESFDHAPVINMTLAEPHMYKGFVSNFTLAKDICHQPDLQGLEGIFINPISVSATKVLSPMFGGSKLGINNEILLPAPMYWNEEERFTGGDDHGIPWSVKGNKAIWRGVATGGTNTETNWRGFQRHRFVSMNNGTKLTNAELGRQEPENFALPEDPYITKAQSDGQLGQWVSEWADCNFIDLMCDPPQDDGSCNYTDPYFERVPGLRMAEQFDYKYVPDIDGNSFSGRYVGFLRSTSLTVKSTLFKEWHDSRLVPWKHFVPMDNRFGDYYSIMEYFIGYDGQGGHDVAAEKIATESKEWAEKVLRKEDMQVYTLRLLLEYARLNDDRREHLGWVDDVLADPSLEGSWSLW